MNCGWTIIAGNQYEEAREHIVCVIAYLLSWKVLISGSFISTKFHQILQISLRELCGLLC